MQLSPHFSLGELTLSQTAARKNIDNTPTSNVLANLYYTAEQLEKIRRLLGYPILISSGYRSPELNRAIGGAAKSQHVEGKAVDFTCPKFGNVEQVMAKITYSNLEYDQVLLEFSRWIHISFSKTGNRKQALIIDHAGTRSYK